MDVFARAGVWPAVRRAVVDYHASAWPGDVLGFDIALIHRGRTSFTLQQRATRVADDRLVAVVETLFVCVDRAEKPVPVPDEIAAALGGARRVELPSGVTLAVDDRGADGVPLLLIHGYPLDRTMWSAQIDGLRGHRVIAPDLRGAGASDSPSAEATLATYADDLAGLLDELDVASVVVCGLSMGGYVTFEFLRRYPDRVRGLILMDTRATADTAEQKAGRDKQAAGAREHGVAPIAAAMVDKLFAAGTDAAVRERVRHRWQRRPRRA